MAHVPFLEPCVFHTYSSPLHKPIYRFYRLIAAGRRRSLGTHGHGPRSRQQHGRNSPTEQIHLYLQVLPYPPWASQSGECHGSLSSFSSQSEREAKPIFVLKVVSYSSTVGKTQNCCQLLLLRRPKWSEIEQTKLETYPVAVVALKVFRICKEKMICTRIWAARWPCEIERWLWVPSVPQGVTIPLDKLQLGPARSR